MGGGVALDGVDRFGEVGGGGHIAETPTGHRVGFAETVNGEGEVVNLLAEGGQGGVFRIVVDQLFVDLVRKDVDLLVQGDLGERGQFVLGVDGAGGVAGGVEDDHLRERAHVLAKQFGRELVAVLGGGRDDDGFAAGHPDHFRIAEPIRGGDEDLVARIDGSEDGVEAGVLGAAGDDDLRGLVAQAVVGLELFGDGGTQFGNAGGRSVLGEAGVEGAHGGGLDVLGCVKIGFAGAETDHVEALGLHGLGAGIDRQGGGGGEVTGAFCGFEGHKVFPWFGSLLN